MTHRPSPGRSRAIDSFRSRAPRGLALALLAAAALAIALPAAARHHSHRSSTTHAPQAGAFDYYLLSMSWSPTYCLTHPDNRDECGRKGYGLIVHGLWPQYEDGGYPQDCGAVPLDEEAMRIGRTLYPSPGLLRHEWQRHGTCSGLAPADYLRTVDRASALLKVPRELESPAIDQRMPARQLVALLRAANPGLPPGALRLACSGGRLAEIRLCVTRDLQWRECGEGVGRGCADDVRIPAAR